MAYLHHFYFFISAAQEEIPSNPCQPSPCGPNSQCRVSNGQSVCSCLPEFRGSPPNCRPECVVSTECAADKTCKNQKCVSPCPGTCGQNSECRVINHSPICTCKDRYTGDPFSSCFKIQGMLIIADFINCFILNKLVSQGVENILNKLLYLFILLFSSSSNSTS